MATVTIQRRHDCKVYTLPLDAISGYEEYPVGVLLSSVKDALSSDYMVLQHIDIVKYPPYLATAAHDACFRLGLFRPHKHEVLGVVESIRLGSDKSFAHIVVSTWS